MIPKAKYRAKVRERLAKVVALFEDDVKFKKYLQILGIFTAGSSELHNAVEHLHKFLDEDVPTLLDALNECAEEQAQMIRDK